MDILEFKDVKTLPDIIHPYTPHIKNNHIPLIIDNGSYNCRVGWATSERPLLVFKNVLAKPRKERGKKDGEVQVGNDITNIEAGRFQLKTQFDRNLVTHFEVQELIFDYIFTHLGIDTVGRVDHPIIITEPFLCPNYSRMLMSELLFECYGVPGVTYAVDSLLSYTYECKTQDGVIVNLGHHASHIIPVVNGEVDFTNSRRLDIGGNNLIMYMYRLLQLKYPAHFAAITISRAEELVHEHCHVAEDYLEELSYWADGDYYDKHVLCIQLPFTSQSSLTPEQQKERRRELARRLIEINARKREEKLAEDEEQLNQLLAIQDLQEEGEEIEFQKAVKEFGLSSCEELPKMISQIQARIEKTKQKIVAANTSEDSISEEPKQKLLKRFQTPKGDEDFKSWVEGVRRKREELLEKRAIRRQKRQDMAKRRTPASVERMRLISQLARNEKRDDDFGMRDEDWDVYKAINKEGGDSDSEGESEKLLELEQVLRAHDPSFNNDNGGGSEAPGETHRLHVGVESIRVPEVLFQPSILGSHQAGITETLGFILRHYPSEVSGTLAKNIFVCGGLSRLPGLCARITKELRELCPFRAEINVRISLEPSFGPWVGAKNLASESNTLQNILVSREEYMERGGEFLKPHFASNPFVPSPVLLNSSELLQTINTSLPDETETDLI